MGEGPHSHCGATAGPLPGVGWGRAAMEEGVEGCSAFRLPFRALLGWTAAARPRASGEGSRGLLLEASLCPPGVLLVG